MNVFKISIPVPSYYGDEVYEQEIYFSAQKPFPTKEELIAKLVEMDEKDSKFPEYTGTWNECVKSVEKAEGYPALSGNHVQTNTFTVVELTGKVVRHPFSAQRFKVY